MASPSRQATDQPRPQDPKLSESGKEKAPRTKASTPKSRRIKISRKEKEFESLLRRAARLQARPHLARQKRDPSKSPVA